MKCKEITMESISKIGDKLYKKIEQKPDAILYIAKGGFLIGKELSDRFKCNLIEVNVFKDEWSSKKKLLNYLFKFPRVLNIILRKIELLLRFYFKNKEIKKIEISEINEDKLKTYSSILLVDDSIDTGDTIKRVSEYIKNINNNVKIKIATINFFKKSKKKVYIDYFVFENVMLLAPWSKDSKEYAEFLLKYKNYKINSEDMRYKFDINLSNENSHKKLLERIKKKSKVLEIGTAYGHMTKYLKENLECYITGVEIDSIMLQEASKFLDEAINLNINNIQKLDVGLRDNYYDFIILGDVLEHTYIPDRILEILKKKIKIKGEILVSVPNVAHNCILMQLLKNDFTYQAEGILDRTHIKFFTSKSFEKLVKKVGLKIKKYDFTYMTPEYEKLSYNNYKEFSLLEREILLKHKNGHFFQNIFVLSKDNIQEQKLVEIDSYNYDKILIILDEEITYERDVFELKGEVKFNILKNVKKIEIYPSFRMRIIKNIEIRIFDEQEKVILNNIYALENNYITFGEGKLTIKKFFAEESILTMKYEYKNISEDFLKDAILKNKIY